MLTKLMSFCVWSHSVTILYCPEFDIHTARKWDFWIQVSSSHPSTRSMHSMPSTMDANALSLGISSRPDLPQTPLLIELWVLTQLETLMKCIVSLYCCGEEEKKRILLMDLFLSASQDSSAEMVIRWVILESSSMSGKLSRAMNFPAIALKSGMSQRTGLLPRK